MELTRACTTTPPLTVTQVANLTFYRGTTFRAKFTFKQPDPMNPLEQIPLDITGMDIVFNVVEEDGTEVLVVDSTSATTNGSIVTILNPPTNGEVEVLVTDEETASLDVAELRWWVTLNPPNGDKLLRGKGSIHVINPY